MLKRVDAVKLSTREITPEGYMSGKVALTTVGVQQYPAYDMTGKDEDIGRMVGVYRPPETVFHKDTRDSARMKPVTLTHPMVDVTADNYTQLALGHLGDTIAALDDKRLGGNILITDKQLVSDVMNGLNEVSMGYSAVMVPKIGEFEGEPYEFAFEGPMIINHLAVVPEGRCGESVRILDRKIEGDKMELVELEKKITDSKNAIDALVGRMGDMEKENADLKTSIDGMTKQLEAFAKKDADEELDPKGAVPPAKKGKKAPKAEEKVAADDVGEEEEGQGGEVVDGKKEEEEGEDCKDKNGVFHNGMNQSFDAKVNDSVDFKVKLLDMAKPYVKDVEGKSNRDILIESCKSFVDEAEKQTNDYLIGALSVAAKSRQDAKDHLQNIPKVTDAYSVGTPKILDALAILQL